VIKTKKMSLEARVEILEKALEKLVRMVKSQDDIIEALSSKISCVEIEVNAPHDLNAYMQEHKNDMSMDEVISGREIQDGVDKYYGK
jgi:vacuolar-type H+-ATPase subunit E/Vma4